MYVLVKRPVYTNRGGPVTRSRLSRKFGFNRSTRGRVNFLKCFFFLSNSTRVSPTVTPVKTNWNARGAKVGFGPRIINEFPRSNNRACILYGTYTRRDFSELFPADRFPALPLLLRLKTRATHTHAGFPATTVLQCFYCSGQYLF